MRQIHREIEREYVVVQEGVKERRAWDLNEP